MSSQQEAIIQVFTEKLKKSQRGTLVAGIILAALCVFFIVIGFIFPGETSTDKIIRNIVVAAAFAGLAGTYYFIQKQRKAYDPEDSILATMAETLNEDGKIVWIYPYKLVRNGVPSYALIFKTDDKVEFRISTSVDEQYKILLMLQHAITNATYGFSDEKRVQYHKDPKSMRV